MDTHHKRLRLCPVMEIKCYKSRFTITTAGTKSGKIKEVIGLGAYHYIQKPIRFNEIENIIKILEEEQAFMKRESEQEQQLVETIKQQEEKTSEHIDFILKSANQISLNRITNILGFTGDFISEYLDKLVQEGKIMKLEDIKEIACNQCDSVRASQIFFCPNCKGSNFKSGKLIE